ncbi:MAG: hypothetical protein AVO38_11590 [delta proteobacterium ML8_D]|nr:MAG: hypothetical protein AVO38_11590 [delta proteobacterium ML8_D]
MKKTVIMIMIIMLGGCTLAKVKVEMLSERTALENQVLGSYNSLDTQMLLVASLRGVDSEGNISLPPESSIEQQEIIAAMQIIDFHADDIDLFKQLRWVGENNQGLITSFGMDHEHIPENAKASARRFSQEEFEAVVNQVNQSREKVMRHVIHMNAYITDADFEEVALIFARIEADQASPGTLIQSEQGRWAVKKEQK